MLLGTSNRSKDTVIFNKSRMHVSAKSDEYNVIFGSGEIDLRNIEELNGKLSKEVNIIFGSGRIYLPKDIPVIVKVETIFGESKLPDGKTDFFGDYLYKNEGATNSSDALYLEVNVVFGSVVIEG